MYLGNIFHCRLEFHCLQSALLRFSDPLSILSILFFDLKRAAFYSEENDMTDFGSYTFFIPYLSWCAYRFFLMRYMSYLDRMNFESSNLLQFSISFLSIFYSLAIRLNMTPSKARTKETMYSVSSYCGWQNKPALVILSYHNGRKT